MKRRNDIASKTIKTERPNTSGQINLGGSSRLKNYAYARGQRGEEKMLKKKHKNYVAVGEQKLP